MNNPNPNFTTTIAVEQSPEEAFGAINNPRGWWSENIEGSTANLGDEWTYRYKDTHLFRCMFQRVGLLCERQFAQFDCGRQGPAQPERAAGELDRRILDGRSLEGPY